MLTNCKPSPTSFGYEPGAAGVPRPVEGAARFAREARPEAAGIRAATVVDPPGLLAMDHVPVENETIIFVAALRHNEMMTPRVFEEGDERRNVLGCVAHSLGPKLRGANIRKDGGP